MKRLSFLLVFSLAAAFGAGCVSSKVKTSTGLPYWPPGSPQREDPTALRRPAAAPPNGALTA